MLLPAVRGSVSTTCGRRNGACLTLGFAMGVAAVAGALALSAPAYSADPGRWTETGRSMMPKEYYQGVTSDPAGRMFFDGPFMGLYRTDSLLGELARNRFAIPGEVRNGVGYNHIGAIAWDARERGRLLLPLACSHPQGGGNTCGTGAIGVADADSLQWRYLVELDRADIAKVPWVAVSPDGALAWTSSGPDLLGYSTADISAPTAEAGRHLRPVKRIPRGAPPSGITGAAFYQGHLIAATMKQRKTGGPFQLWSIDVATGARRLEIERQIVGESEGVAAVRALGGTLHWQILPYNPQGLPPTYGAEDATLLHFVPTRRSSKREACSWIRNGTPASDTVTGTANGDKLSGFERNDVLRGRSGNDCLFGGPGRDRLLGGRGRDLLIGSAGHDRLLGGGGADMLFGDAGNDRLTGQAGDDKLFGGEGNDVLSGGRGHDKLVAGPGDDVIDARDGRRDIVECGPGRDIVLANTSDRLSNCEIKHLAD